MNDEDKYTKYYTILIKYYQTRLSKLMRSIEVGSKILIFCETKRGVEDITRRMRQDGYHGVRGIHGDKTQAVCVVVPVLIEFHRREIKSIEISRRVLTMC